MSYMEKTELKNCPFCGTGVKIEKTEGGDSLIRCSVCHVHMFDKMEWAETDEAELIKAWNKRATEANSGVVSGCVHKRWLIEYIPKPGRPGLIDWDATHPDEETCFNGKSPADLQDQIDAFLDT
jgi:hypothetical protein